MPAVGAHLGATTQPSVAAVLSVAVAAGAALTPAAGSLRYSAPPARAPGLGPVPAASPSMPAPSQHHKRRHRKKLHLGEFTQLGFSLNARCPPDWDDARREQAMLALIAAIEARDLNYGGGDSASGLDAYVYASGGRSCSDADREAVQATLQTLGFIAVTIEPLSDAWHDEVGAD